MEAPSYQPNLVHRNGAAGKSQWTIPLTAEIDAFNRSWVEGWLFDALGWGLHLSDGQPDWVGVAQDHDTQLFVAKFVGQADSVWHGYPADHMHNPQDIPHEDVLGSWIEDDLLSRAKARKIMRGQRCSL